MKNTGREETFRIRISPFGYNVKTSLSAQPTLKGKHFGWMPVDFDSFKCFSQDENPLTILQGVVLHKVMMGHKIIEGIPIQEDVQFDISDIRQVGWAKNSANSEMTCGIIDPDWIAISDFYISRVIPKDDPSMHVGQNAQCFLTLREVEMSDFEFVAAQTNLVQSADIRGGGGKFAANPVII